MNSVKFQYTKLTSVTFLPVDNELSEREIRKIIPFTSASKRMKSLGINLIQEVKDLYSENYKTLMIEVKDNTNRKVYCVHGLEELMLLKWLNYPRQSTDLV